MRYSTRYRSTYYSSGSFPPGVKWLVIANVVAFLCLPASRQITGQVLHTSAGAVVSAG